MSLCRFMSFLRLWDGYIWKKTMLLNNHHQNGRNQKLHRQLFKNPKLIPCPTRSSPHSPNMADCWWFCPRENRLQFKVDPPQTSPWLAVWEIQLFDNPYIYTYICICRKRFNVCTCRMCKYIIYIYTHTCVSIKAYQNDSRCIWKELVPSLCGSFKRPVTNSDQLWPWCSPRDCSIVGPLEESLQVHRVHNHQHRKVSGTLYWKMMLIDFSG